MGVGAATAMAQHKKVFAALFSKSAYFLCAVVIDGARTDDTSRCN
jgi:hypothetical protein